MSMHTTVFDAQFVFPHDGGSAVAQQFVVVQQASGNGVLYSQHTYGVAVLLHVVKNLFEGVTAYQLNLFVGKELMGCNVVERPRYSLYRYLFHLSSNKNPAVPWMESGMSYLKVLFNSLIRYTYNLPLHFIAKVKVIKEEVKECMQCFHFSIVLF